MDSPPPYSPASVIFSDARAREIVVDARTVRFVLQCNREKEMARVREEYRRLSRKYGIRRLEELKDHSKHCLKKQTSETSDVGVSNNTFRLMQWNVLAKGLENDGFFVNPVLDAWPVRRDSFPMTDGRSQKTAKEMIETMYSVTEEFKKAMKAEIDRFVRTKEEEATFIAAMTSPKKIARKGVKKEAGASSKDSEGDEPQATTFRVSDNIKDNIRDSVKSHIVQASTNRTKLMKEYGLDTEKELHLLVLTAMKLQAIFRGHRGRVHAKLAKTFMQKKIAAIEELQKQYCTPQLIANSAAVLRWELRWCRIREMIWDARPDIITMQEVDTLKQMQPDLEALGYACGFPGNRYRRPMHVAKLASERCIDYVRRSGIAFAPNFPSTALAISLGAAIDKKIFAEAARATMDGTLPYGGGKWKPRSLFKSKAFWNEAGGTSRLIQEARRLGCVVPDACEFDGDGSVIFWRKDRFEVVDIDYVQIGAASMLKFKCAVKVTLRDKSSGALIQIITSHLSSGATMADNKKRMRELFGDEKSEDITPSVRGLYAWATEAAKHKRCIVSIDANSRPQFRADRTVWRSFSGCGSCAKHPSAPKKSFPWRSVWDAFFDRNGDPYPSKGGDAPVTVNKMRGATSQQAKKIGEHAYELIDQVWYTKSGVRFVQHGAAPKQYRDRAAAREKLIPSILNPSDHMPVIADFRFC